MRKVRNRGFTFGTLAYGGRVKHLAKLGRVITSEAHPLPDKIEKYLMRKAKQYVQKRLNKIPDRKIVIKK